MSKLLDDCRALSVDAMANRSTGHISLPKEEFAALLDEIEQLRNDCRWCAQTIHQAYHDEIEGDEVGGDWQECHRAICSGVRRILGEKP